MRMLFNFVCWTLDDRMFFLLVIRLWSLQSTVTSMNPVCTVQWSDFVDSQSKLPLHWSIWRRRMSFIHLSIHSLVWLFQKIRLEPFAREAAWFGWVIWTRDLRSSDPRFKSYSSRGCMVINSSTALAHSQQIWLLLIETLNYRLSLFEFFHCGPENPKRVVVIEVHIYMYTFQSQLWTGLESGVTTLSFLLRHSFHWCCSWWK